MDLKSQLAKSWNFTFMFYPFYSAENNFQQRGAKAFVHANFPKLKNLLFGKPIITKNSVNVLVR